MAQLCGLAEIFARILSTDAAKYILSGVYQLIRMHADMVQIIAAGIAWLVMRAVEKFVWLLGNVLEWMLKLLLVS